MPVDPHLRLFELALSLESLESFTTPRTASRLKWLSLARRSTKKSSAPRWNHSQTGLPLQFTLVWSSHTAPSVGPFVGAAAEMSIVFTLSQR